MPLDFATAIERTHGAIRQRDAAALAQTLSNLGYGMDANNLTQEGERPLNVAASIGFAAGCQVLLNNGANPMLASDANTDRGFLPISFAMRCTDTAATLATCRCLVGAGADIERTHEHAGHPPPLRTVVGAREINLELACGLLELGASIASWPNYLHWQTSRTDITPESLGAAVALAAGKIPAANASRVTALHSLCASPSVTAKLVKTLKSVTEGVKSKEGTLPVTLLCRNPAVDEDTLQAVLEGLPRGMSVSDCTGSAGIHDLCKNPSWNYKIAKIAARYDPEGLKVRDPNKSTALHLTCLR